MYKIIEVYGIYTNRGETLAGNIKDYFTDKVKADEYAKGKGFYGGDAETVKFDAIKLDNGNIFLLRQTAPIVVNLTKEEKDTLTEKALEKLTDIEKIVLGLFK